MNKGQENKNQRDVGVVTDGADVQEEDGLTCQLEIMIMVVKKNARKHITSISLSRFS